MTSVLCVISHSSAGGAQALWANLAEGLRSRGHDTRLVALYPASGRNQTAPDGLPWTYISEARPNSPIASLRLLRRLSNFVRAEAADLAITALPAANALVPIAAGLASAKTRVAISHHIPVENYRRWQERLDRNIGAGRRVSAVVCVSEGIASAFADYPPAYRRKTRVIGNALPPEMSVAARHLARWRSLRKRQRVVIATGRLAPEKNYPTLLQATALLDDTMLRIIGDGPDRADLMATAKNLGIADRVEFVGAINRSEVLPALAAADVFVLPSHYEGHNGLAGVGGQIHERNLKAADFRVRAATRPHHWGSGPVDRLDCGGLYRSEAVRKAGYFADRNLHAFEEFDLGARLAAKGFGLARIDAHAADHFGHATSSARLLLRRVMTGYAGAAAR